MVHRSIIGSLERAVAHLVDVHGGALPPWLAPVQVVALPIADAELPLADAFVREAVDQGLRAELDGPAHGSLGARIRSNRFVPYLAVIGSAEAAAAEVSLRLRDGCKLPPMRSADAIRRICQRISRHTVHLWTEEEVR
jgi:threonyl-tRNA synthetase